MKTLCILGRLPALSTAELESLYGASRLTPLNTHAVLVAAPVDFARLGGCLKAARLITTLDTTNPQKAFDYCRKFLPDIIEVASEGKIKLGVSLYGIAMPLQKINANALSLKKTLVASGRSARVVPNTEPALSSAQVYHNHLTAETGIELVFVSDGKQIYIGQTTDVQNIDSYTMRDRSRPKRDAFVGMLPPKLAQTLINLATGKQPADDETGSLTIVDPFCGTGVILQEALLMGYPVYGTDNSPKMVDYSRANLEWLTTKCNTAHLDSRVELADATTYQWDFAAHSMAIASETYLGQPLGGQHPTPEKLHQIIHDCNEIIRAFLKNIASQLPAGTPLCIAIPAWRIDGTIHHLPLVKEIDSYGYHQVSFSHAAASDLLYYRDDQVTARQILVLSRD